MGTIVYFCDLCGPLRPSPRTPLGSMDPRLRTYVLDKAWKVGNGLGTAGLADGPVPGREAEGAENMNLH
jgi:hypothetical protein